VIRVGGRIGALPAVLARADLARDLKDWPVAVDLYRQHLERRRRAFPIWVQLGHALKEDGRLTAALAAYGRALALRPSDPDLLLNLGHISKVMGHRRSAIEFYRESFLVNANSAARAELLGLGAGVVGHETLLGASPRKHGQGIGSSIWAVFAPTRKDK
jgi:tetratricopeptide (TPR) repeat protein